MSILIAAKLEEPIQPSFERMIKLVQRDWQLSIEKNAMIELEIDILNKLDWDMLRPGPLFFLDRFV